MPKNEASGLPPERGALAAHLTQIDQTKEELERLRSGAEKLAAEIFKADAAKSEIERQISSDAATVLDKIKSGCEWALNQFTGAPVQDLSQRLQASEHQATVARTALEQTLQAIRDSEQKLVELNQATQAVVQEAVRESIFTLYHDWEATLDNLRELMSQLGGFQRFLGMGGGRRLVAVVPTFVPGQLTEEPIACHSADVESAEEAFRDFAKRLLADPALPISALKLPRPEADRLETVTYDHMHPLERRQVDIHFAKGT